MDIDIFVISEPKWLKFGLQAHFLKVFGHTKLQLPISCTFKVMILLVMYLVISTMKVLLQERDREVKFCMQKHFEKMCLATKFQPY